MTKGDVHTYWDGEKWVNKVEGNQRISYSHTTRRDAETKGAQTAKGNKSEHTVHNKRDGKISRKDSYGNDPNPPKG